MRPIAVQSGEVLECKSRFTHTTACTTEQLTSQQYKFSSALHKRPPTRLSERTRGRTVCAQLIFLRPRDEGVCAGMEN